MATESRFHCASRLLQEPFSIRISSSESHLFTRFYLSPGSKRLPSAKIGFVSITSGSPLLGKLPSIRSLSKMVKIFASGLPDTTTRRGPWPMHFLVVAKSKNG